MEDPLEEGVGSHTSILAWRISWRKELDGLQSTVAQSQTQLKWLRMNACIGLKVVSTQMEKKIGRRTDLLGEMERILCILRWFIVAAFWWLPQRFLHPDLETVSTLLYILVGNWVNSWSWWWTGRPGLLWFMGSQRVGHDWATELNWRFQINRH